MEATLSQILDAREKRALHQKALLAQYGKPLICFTMNIAGPQKDSPLIRQGFCLGDRLLRAQLQGSGLRILHREADFAPTGPVGYYVADADASELKRLTCEIEDDSPVARLFDMDVLSSDGSKYSREDLGFAARKCLICKEDARVCGRSRAHSVERLREKTNELLQQAVCDHTARHIASLAVQSLLWEVCTTPKPGLVDCQGSGSHRDMDIFTFTASAAALYPYFESCVRMGMQTADLAPDETFRRLRLPGKGAEQKMYEATGGVNTHKGAIFSLGILCAAVGRTSTADTDSLLAQCAQMTRGICGRELGKGTSKTHGETLYAKYGIRGVRGQAEEGFPAVRTGLDILEKGLAAGLSINDAGCAALLHIMVSAEDSNLIARSDPQTCQSILRDIGQMLSADPFPQKEQLESLDREFIQKNLSPGGSADLLAMAYFLHLLGQIPSENSDFE